MACQYRDWSQTTETPYAEVTKCVHVGLDFEDSVWEQMSCVETIISEKLAQNDLKQNFRRRYDYK